MSKIKHSGLDQYGAEPFEQQQFGTAGVEGVKLSDCSTSSVFRSYASDTAAKIRTTRYRYIMPWA